MVDFTREALTRVVNNRRPTATPIRDAHFSGPGQFHNSNLILVDIIKGPEGIATAIGSGVRSLRSPQGSVEELNIKIPRFSEHDVIKPGDYNGRRMPGSDMAYNSQGIQQLYVGKLDKLRARMDRTFEYMAIKGMQGEIVDGKGNVLVTYDVLSPQTVDFRPTTAGDDPYEVFVKDVSVAIHQEIGGSPGQLIGYCGTDAFIRLYKQHAVQSKLTAASPQVTVTEATIAIAGIPITFRLMPHNYLDDSGNSQVFIPADKIIIASTGMETEAHYGPCEAPGMQLVQQPFIADTWEERDPPATKVRVETNPLPLIRRPKAIRTLTVTDGS